MEQMEFSEFIHLFFIRGYTAKQPIFLRAMLKASVNNSGLLSYDQLQIKSARIGQIIERTDEITMRWLELSEK